MDSIVSTIIQKSSQVGKAQSSLELLIAIIIGVILFIIGYNINNYSNFQKTMAKIINIYCDVNVYNNNLYVCTMDVEYYVNNIKFISILNTNTNKNFYKSKNIQIYYNSLNPREIFFEDVNNNIFASISFIISVTIVLFALINFYLTQTNENYASLLGINVFLNKFSELFKK